MPKLFDAVGLFPLFVCQESIFGIMHKIDYKGARTAEKYLQVKRIFRNLVIVIVNLGLERGITCLRNLRDLAR